MSTATLENGVSLEYEIHGDPSLPVVFVILGITDNITDWPVGLYEPVVEKGYCVVRYELRDAGYSTKFEDTGYGDLALALQRLAEGKKLEGVYTGHDMAEDAVLLMDHLKIGSAFILGYSYGAMVAQLLALQDPQKVLGLICLQGSNYNPALPARKKEVEQAMFNATLEYEAQEQKIAAIKALRMATNGSIHFMDEKEAEQSATTSVNRMYCPRGTARMVMSRLVTPPFFESTWEIKCPALILHGDEDPIFSLEHGEDMANRLSNSTLVVLKGVGHNHPSSIQPIIVEHLVKFLDATIKNVRS